MLFDEFAYSGADTILGAAFPALCQLILGYALISIVSIRHKAKRLAGSVGAPFRNAPAFIQQSPRRMSRETQWARISGALGGGIARADAAREFQLAAGRQVDAAAYAVQSMLEELSAVMKLPSPGAAELIAIPTIAATAPSHVQRTDSLAA